MKNDVIKIIFLLRNGRILSYFGLVKFPVFQGLFVSKNVLD